MRARTGAALVWAWLLALAGLAAAPSASGAGRGSEAGGSSLQAVATDERGFVVFQAVVPGTSGSTELFWMHDDGSGLRALTHDDARVSWPAISPDGRYVAFFSDRRGVWDLVRVRSDGSHRETLVPNLQAGRYWSPAGLDWHPDGDVLVLGLHLGEVTRPYLLELGSRSLTPLLDDGLESSQLVYDFTGKWILMRRGRPSKAFTSDVWRVASDGSSATQMTFDATGGSYVGLALAAVEVTVAGRRRVAFVRQEDFWHVHVYLMDWDGSNMVRLSDPDALEPEVASCANVPDELLIRSDRGVRGQWGLWRVNVITRRARRLVRMDAQQVRWWAPPARATKP